MKLHIIRSRCSLWGTLNFTPSRLDWSRLLLIWRYVIIQCQTPILFINAVQSIASVQPN